MKTIQRNRHNEIILFFEVIEWSEGFSVCGRNSNQEIIFEEGYIDDSSGADDRCNYLNRNNLV